MNAKSWLNCGWVQHLFGWYHKDSQLPFIVWFSHDLGPTQLQQDSSPEVHCLAAYQPHFTGCLLPRARTQWLASNGKCSQGHQFHLWAHHHFIVVNIIACMYLVCSYYYYYHYYYLLYIVVNYEYYIDWFSCCVTCNANYTITRYWLGCKCNKGASVVANIIHFTMRHTDTTYPDQLLWKQPHCS